MRTSATLFIRFALVGAITLGASSTASAQVDPLLFLKNQSPNIVVAIDTGNRMQRDADLTYYDPSLYAKDSGLLGVVPLNLLPTEVSKFYRRRFPQLTHTESSGNDRFTGPNLEAVGDLESTFATFYERTRLAIARRGVLQAMQDNKSSARFGLIRMRQASAALPNSPNYEVRVSDVNQQSPTDAGSGKWKITRPTVTQDNGAVGTSGLLVSPDATGAFTTVSDWLTRDFSNGGLIPAGRDDKVKVDAPVGLMLDDARTEAARLIAADSTGCRNTAVILIVGGGEGATNANLQSKANSFLNVSGRRVPIYVVALAPATTAERDALSEVATTSGGLFFEITKAMIEATTAGQPVPEVVRAVNLAVQHTYTSSTAFNTAPSGSFPIGPSSEFEVTSPVVGTVNLTNGFKMNATTGALESIPVGETDILHVTSKTRIPLRSNVLVTSAFSLPGFEGKLRAIRVYRPEPDVTKPSGYKFTQDGSRLWVGSVPAAASRNIYTILPGTTNTVKFHTDNVDSIKAYLGVSDPSTLIDWIRNQPLGAVVGSTPAFADPPSLDPPPDAAYPGFAADHATRRSLIYVGANDGMLHAIDSRTGVEVWAFIPFNLLPKLNALRSGQSMDAFKYFVDSSPKIADVKIGADWRTYLFIGQGPGGTYYNTFDITLDGIESSVSDTSNDMTALLNYFATPDRVTWEWSFPRNTVFDHTIAPYGDISSSATDVEKTVGETWSDPAIGQVSSEDGPYVMLVGSGFLKRSVENQANRGGARGGRSFYALDVRTGEVITSRDVGADNSGEDDDSCRTANNCSRIKNALQMDPVATGPVDSRYVSKAYIGDLDGKVWRFDLGLNAANVVTMAAPVQLYAAGAGHPLFASMAYVNVGGSNEYIFVGTGSDLLPSNGVSQSYSMLVLKDNGGSATKTAEILLERVDGTSPDEKVTAFPAVAGDIVFFSTTSIDPSAPCSPFTANLYAFTFTGGPAYDTNNDGSLTGATTTGSGKKAVTTPGDSTKVFSKAGARGTSPFIVDQHLVFSIGGELEMFGDPDDFNNGVGQAGVRILSWRMVR
jgi:hypothetical protein